MYEQGDYNLTAEHTLLYDEIKKIKEQAEEEAEKAPVPQPPLPPVGIWYIFVVIIIFAGFFYWASTKVLNKPQPKALRVSRLMPLNAASDPAERWVMSGSMNEVCAELDRRVRLGLQT